MVLRLVLGALVGGLAGFGYYRLVGCGAGGACPITSNPWLMTTFGALVGAAVVAG